MVGWDLLDVVGAGWREEGVVTVVEVEVEGGAYSRNLL